MARLVLEEVPLAVTGRLHELVRARSAVIAYDSVDAPHVVPAPVWDDAKRPQVLRSHSRPFVIPGDRVVRAPGTVTWKLELWDVATRRTVWKTVGPHGESFAGVGLAPDGESLILGCKVTHDPLTDHHEVRIRRIPLATGGEGALLYSRDDDAIVDLWPLPDGRIVLASHCSALDVLDPATKKILTFDRDSRDPQHVAVLDGGKTLVTTHPDAPVRYWRVADGTLLREEGRHDGYVTTLLVLDGGRRVVSTGRHGTVVGGATPFRVDTTVLEDAAPLGESSLVFACEDGVIGLADLAEGREIARTTAPGGPPIACVAFDENRVAVAFRHGRLFVVSQA